MITPRNSIKARYDPNYFERTIKRTREDAMCKRIKLFGITIKIINYE